ncbi:MAG TPA: bacteriohemerythrin [Mobilitalea sp.]|nr:bacteriohemerythrin [Mobilitalea sp.]
MLKWSDNFSVHHPELDKQHKVLISIVDDLTKAIDDNNSRESTVLDIAIRLDEYIQEHFRYEEALMKQYSYPDKEIHISQHELINDKITGFNIYEVGKPMEFYEDALVFCAEWLLYHIMHSDRRLGLYLNQY